jgi:CubicO group peptidase (beta-lactamase class C family)
MDAPIEGFVAKGFEPVRAAFAQNFADGMEIGASFAVMINEEPVVNVWGGWRDRAGTIPWTADTLTAIHSTTKPIAAIAVAMQVEDGLIEYDKPVAGYWPEFAAEGKDQLTVAQVLSHQGGLCGFIDPIDPNLWLDQRGLTAALAALKPLWTPGSASGYHPLTFGYIADELLRRVSGKKVGDVVRNELCGPNGIDFRLGIQDADLPRYAEQTLPTGIADFGEITIPKKAAFFVPWAGPRRGDPAWRRMEIPSGAGVATAYALAQLFGVFAHGGKLGDLRLMSPETFAELSAERIDGNDLVMPYPIAWAAGVMRNKHGAFGPEPQTLAHSGRGGSFGFGDPVRGMAGGYVMNKLSQDLLMDPRKQRLLDALYACL